jgi:nitroimidazol reductase NimA-like FMN-containing flavoprotein (pyridoxamine 5'-phosphate oxidase superfamily)
MSETQQDLGPNLDHAGMEILNVEACHRLLGAARIGRIAFVDRGEPVILPICIALIGESVLFATDEGSKLEAAVMERPVAVEVDAWDQASRTGWSVLVKGTAAPIDDERDLASLDARGLAQWLRPDAPKRWVRVLPNEITGRRLPPS